MMQPRRLASQEKLWHKTPSPRRIGSLFPLGMWGGLSRFGFFLFLFLTAFLLSFFFPFFDLPQHGTGMGRPRGGCTMDVRTMWRMDEQRR
jgi:hypothetical protein